MEYGLISNPLYLIFKMDSSGILSEEIEDPSKFDSLYKYILDYSIKENKITVINIINILTELIKKQRSICAYFPKYENKSIYIFLFQLFLNQKNSTKLKQAIINLIYELSMNIKLSKEDYEFIFQNFSKLYRKDKAFLSYIKNTNYTFTEYFSALLEILNSTLEKTDIEKNTPTNYFSCFGNNSFNLNFNSDNLIIGNCCSFILNFKINKSNILVKNPELFKTCRLISIKFSDTNKILNIDLQYPFLIILKDGNEEIKSKICPVGEWINLIITFCENNVYFFMNGENNKKSIKLKNIKIANNDKINSISFFENFFGEVTSITIISQKYNEAFNVFFTTLKFFSEMKKGLWDRKSINNFLKYIQEITYSDKKRDKGGGSLYDDIVCIFTPVNYNQSNPKIIEDCFGNYFLEINGNIRNHKYYQYQKNISQICPINSFLPIMEMLFIYQKELLNDKNFGDVLSLISKLVLGKENIIAMNKLKFFKILGLILEKLPNEFFKEKILNEFENIGNNILEQNSYLKDFYSDYFKDVFLNEKIIFKFDDTLKLSFWNIFLQFYLFYKDYILHYLNMNIICNILLHYDELTHEKMCCEFHFNMYKKDFLDNIPFIKPALNYQLITLEKFFSEYILNQSVESINQLIELLLLDLSPCIIKFILNILINIFTNNHKEDDWKKKIALELIIDKFFTIFVNLFIRSLPDIRYEILILMFHIYLKVNNSDKFSMFEKMIKTCLLPQNFFYNEKNVDNQHQNKENINYTIITDLDKNNDVSNNEVKKQEKEIKSDGNNNIIEDKNNDKSNEEKEKENIKQIDTAKKKEEEEKKTNKRNSIKSLAGKFESKNTKNETKVTNTFNTKTNPQKLSGAKSNIIQPKLTKQISELISKFHNSNEPKKNDNKKKPSTIQKINKPLVNQNQVKPNIINDKIINEKIIPKEDLIINDDIFEKYIINIYNVLLQWTLGIPILYTSNKSFELFTAASKDKKADESKKLIMHNNILDIIFVLNKSLDNINFTLLFIKDLESLIKYPENCYLIIIKDKLYCSLLDIAYKYYNQNTEKETEIFYLIKKLCNDIFINSIKYLKNQIRELPMKRVEMIFLWGTRNLNYTNNDETTYDFIYYILLDLLGKLRIEFKEELDSIFEFKAEFSDIKKNYYLKNYLLVLNFVYIFCIHYKVDIDIFQSEANSLFDSSLNINIPKIFISGMRVNESKGINISEYWKDFHLIEVILNELDYIFKYSHIKNKIYKHKLSTKQKKKEKCKGSTIKYDKYSKILNDTILNTNKRNLFSKELYILCFTEIIDKNNISIIPLIKMISISYICILSLIKKFDDKTQFLVYLERYKNLIRFLIIASINLNKKKSEDNLYDKIQNFCFEVISSGLCFLYDLIDNCLFKDEVIRVINNLFLLCFSILKIFFNKKLYNNPEITSFQNAILILFCDYMKDENKTPFLNLAKIESIYLKQNKQIYELIKDKKFSDLFFRNKNLKIKLFEDYYSLEEYKSIVEKRFKLLISLEDKLDFSYQIKIYDIFPEFEKSAIKYYNKRMKKYIKNRKEYKRQKEKIFSFSGMWSNKDIFYKNSEKYKIKYKVMNHYSNNFMRPLLRPILDINYYLPEFSIFKKEKLFLKNKNNSIDKEDNNSASYDLILDFDKMIKISNSLNIDNNKKEENKNKSIKSIFREKYYKQDQKYYDFLLNVSKIIGISEEEPQDESISINTSKGPQDELIRLNTLKKRKETTATVSTRKSTTSKGFRYTFSFQTFMSLSYDKEKKKLNNEEIYVGLDYYICCLVKSTHHIKGIFYFKDNKLCLKNLAGQKIETELELELNEKDDNYDIEKDECYGSYFKKYQKDKNFYKLSIKYDDIKFILKKKYCYKNSAIEIFTIQNKSYFFNFNSENLRKIILDEILKKIGDYSMIINDTKEINLRDSKIVSNNNVIGYLNNKNISILNKNDSKKSSIKLSKLIKLWKNWEISNFELLMYLNIFSNRSYLDISQYPVFPWILANYEDPLIKEKKPDTQKDYIYRDLSLPMGMLTIDELSKKRSFTYTSTFKIFKEDSSVNKPYFYGCNYSNPTYICNYLIRLFPYTQACIEIQGTGFDTPHRLFTSVLKAFKNASSQSTDVREIIPEFFYLPEMYLNINNLDLGKFKDKNTQVGGVVTPCENNPFKFTAILKNILENEKVSYNINRWIDLIFGIKAKEKEAEEAKNLFTEQAYQEDINLEEIEDKNSFIKYIEFGLIPNQLFNTKEMEKKEKLEEVYKIKQITDINYNLKIVKNIKNINNDKLEQLCLIGFKNISNTNRIIMIYNNSLIIEKKITYTNKDCTDEIISKKQIKHNINKISFNYINNIQDNKNVLILKEGKIIIIGGYYDGKISVILNEADINTPIKITPFKDESIVTVINTDYDEKYLFLGNILGNISIMIIESENIYDWKEIYFINAHDNIISSIEINYQLNIWASASIDGLINLYTLPTYKSTISFKLETNNFCNYIFLCDSPLPSILIICQEEIFLYSINGNKIYYQKENSKLINPIIIKDFMKNDFFAYITNFKEIIIRNVSDFSLISNIKLDKEIFYLYPCENNKILYAINKSGTEFNVVSCDNKKEIK